MKILFAASEAGPFIRTGGLGDVAAALPVALSKENNDVRVILPLYEDIKPAYRNNMVFVGSAYVSVGWRKQYAGLFYCIYNNVTFYFVDNEYYFKRKGLYGFFDDGERFAFFSRAILELMPMMNFYPDALHVNDWQTALVPVFLDSFYRSRPEYAGIKTVLAIHNIEFQGSMDKYCIKDLFGLPDHTYSVAEYKNSANMLKAGIEASNKVVTVSPTYSEEILNPFFSYGLEDILRVRRYKLSGILNGIDTELYDPLTDAALFQRFSLKSIGRKAKNKEGLQALVGLPVSDKPLIGMVTRLTAQKGIDLVLRVIDDIMSLDIQLVILGTGDWKFENALHEAQKKYPLKLAVVINFSSDLASKIYGGTDMFLMPSKFEPCGLSQMIAMRYGSVPIVRETGGLKDTVIPYNPETKEGRGFTFNSYDAFDMLDAIKRAVNLFENKAEWRIIVKNAMAADMSWTSSAKSYIDLYKNL